ncbi:hypothetical protein VP06_10925 [Methylobacterium aquaticum]|uniref:Uncharacterized protein n=1 Tax=Methylobacterium aquaticum TaxID=270351 RepID=A0A0J6SQT1_9HYPH|nr:hypothetical protein VP06_10925 [Methylobacterium aquaticum]
MVLSETVPLVGPLTLVIDRASPFGSVSLASKVEVAKVTAVLRVTAGPVSLTAFGAWLVALLFGLKTTSTQ